MTAVLDFVLQFRDEQVAEEVRRKAELGWLDMEFTIYGTAYRERNQMRYRVSSEAEDIYRFREKAQGQGLCCANVLMETKRCSVPIGTKEDTEYALKKQLAKRLQRVYPQELFMLLAEISESIQDDAAYPWLCQLQAETEGLFEEDKLAFFAMMAAYCYGQLHLSAENYHLFNNWLAEERRCMEDDLVEKDLFAKGFAGFIYADKTAEEGFRYLEDSLLAYVAQEKCRLNLENRLTGPIYERTFYYNHSQSPSQLRRLFLSQLKATMDVDFWHQLQAINSQRKLSAAKLAQAAYFGEEAKETLKIYLGQWQVAVF